VRIAVIMEVVKLITPAAARKEVVATVVQVKVVK